MKLAIIGWPIGHSKSPAMQSAALAALGIDGEYTAHAVAPDELAQFVEHAPQKGFRGVNVTIPHKEAALRLCAPDELAPRVGAVNTLVFDGDTPPATTPTCTAFWRWPKRLGAPLDGTSSCSARAAARARWRTPSTATASWRSSPAHRARLPRRRRGHDRDAVEATTSLAKLLPRADVLIDATPRGLDDAAPPIESSPLPAHAVVLDLVVARDTALTRAAKARGLKAAAGAADARASRRARARAVDRQEARPSTSCARRSTLRCDCGDSPRSPWPRSSTPRQSFRIFALDVRYATAATSRTSASTRTRAASCTTTVARRLADVQRELRARGLGLVVYDCYRPLSVQKKMWRWCPTSATSSDPAKGLAPQPRRRRRPRLVDKRGRALPMPSAYDEFSERAHRDFAGGTDEARANRALPRGRHAAPRLRRPADRVVALRRRRLAELPDRRRAAVISVATP